VHDNRQIMNGKGFGRKYSGLIEALSPKAE
jgi:hypothetical protein